MHQEDDMDRSAWLVFFFATFTFSADAKLTWNSPVKVTDGKATYSASIAAGATKFDQPLTITANTSLTGGTVTYAAQAPFTVNANNGTITIATALPYATTATHSVNITATEKFQNKSDASTDYVTLTVTVVYPKPFSTTARSVCVADGTKAGGNTANAFKVSANTMLAAKTLNKEDGASYTLTIKADNKPDELELTVTVGDCSTASLLAPLGLLTLMMASFATMN